MIRSIPEFFATCKSLVANCGGLSFRGRRFAGHLRATVDEDQHIEIMHALILPNGVRKTTNYARNHEAIVDVINKYGVQLASSIRVIDIGCSSGIDAIQTQRALDKLGHEVCQYVLGDLYSEILIDPTGNFVYDSFGNPLQIKLGPFFYSINFSYSFAFQKLLCIPQRLLSIALKPLIPCAHSDCVTKGLINVASQRPFEVKCVDVFRRLPQSSEDIQAYDFVICLHLLVRRYFDPATIERGVENLKEYVAEGGFLAVGDREDPKLYQRKNNQFFQLR